MDMNDTDRRDPFPIDAWEPFPLTACLTSAREAAGLSTNDVSRLTGIKQPSITRAERGGRSLKWTTVLKIMSECGYGLEFFFPADVILAAADRIRPIPGHHRDGHRVGA